MFLTAAKIANVKKVLFNCQKENRKKTLWNSCSQTLVRQKEIKVNNFN